MSTLSVCLIAKNESEVIGRCLICATSFADEIIVVDTGSTDNTKEIAAKYTDKIFDFPWIDDFAAARNFSFSKATKDYVMWLDCDDIIDHEQQQRIVNYKKKLPEYECDTFMANYQVGAGQANAVTRIVRNGTAKWEGFVHEYLATRGNRIPLDFTITHGKPQNSIVRDTGRNLRIFERKLAEGVKFNTRDTLYYAKELYWNGHNEKSLEWFGKFFERPDKWIEDSIEATRIKADILGKLGRHEEMVEWLASAIVKYGMNNRLMYMCGLGLYNQKKYEAATMYFLSVVNGTGFDSEFFKDGNDYKFHSLVWLSCCFWYRGKKDIAKQFHEQAKAIKPNSPVVLNNDKFFNGV